MSDYEKPLRVDLNRYSNAYVVQQVAHLTLDDYTFNDIYLWLQGELVATTKRDHQNLLDLAQYIWYRTGRGKTTLDEVPIGLWLLKA